MQTTSNFTNILNTMSVQPQSIQPRTACPNAPRIVTTDITTELLLLSKPCTRTRKTQLKCSSRKARCACLQWQRPQTERICSKQLHISAGGTSCREAGARFFAFMHALYRVRGCRELQTVRERERGKTRSGNEPDRELIRRFARSASERISNK